MHELKGRSEGKDAGQVFHEFAAFCDQQLQNPDSLDDFKRLEKLRHQKEAEVQELQRMLKNAGSQEDKGRLTGHATKAKQWFTMDNSEYQRVLETRKTLLQQSLENYLLALKACETYNSDALRFCAQWFKESDNVVANAAVKKHLGEVATRKFAPLMSQLSSRLLNSDSEFQALLFSLVLNICADHPYHGMYQIYSGSKSKTGKDEAALSRLEAALKIVGRLSNDQKTRSLWKSVNATSSAYIRLAAERNEKFKPGLRMPLVKSAQGVAMQERVIACRIPPPTMKIQIRHDCDYSSVPVVTGYKPEIVIASGVSMPKIVTAIASDGLSYKQLVCDPERSRCIKQELKCLNR
jgi:ataxia telangiectasia mutated family protein